MKRVVDRLKIRDVPAYLHSKTGVTRKRWTIYKWIKVGLRNYSNQIVKLRSEKILNKFYTRKSWVDDFIREIDE